MSGNTTEQLPQQLEPEPRPPRRWGKWPRRLAFGIGALVLIGIGASIGAGAKTTGISTTTYNASQAKVSALEGQVSTLNGQMSGMQTQVSNDNAALTTAQTKATHATAIANANAAAAYKNREAALSATYQSKEASLASTYQSKEATLAATQHTANSEAAQLKQELGQVQANTISGDGVYVVGKDIKAGTWHTNGSGNTGQNDCYLAVLTSSTNTSDVNNIAFNNNFDGSETVDLSSAYAFDVSGPCSWSLVP
jgi:hypothetical protein